MKELALQIGKPTPLTAIVSVPETIDPNKPAVLILNSGIMHHIGTCRLSVKIARRLAASGVLCIRFDLSGIGDSPPRTGSSSFHESAIQEITEVMNYLENKRGIQRFIVYGLCSGADAAYDIALEDHRVIAIAQIDPYCYRTLGWYVRHYGPRIFKLSNWLSSFKARFLSSTSRQKFSESVDAENLIMPSYIREFPPKQEIEAGIEKLIERQVSILNLFTNGQSYILNHASQFKRTFPNISFGDRLTVDYQERMDHIITHPEMQAYAVDLVCDWVLSRAT